MRHLDEDDRSMAHDSAGCGDHAVLCRSLVSHIFGRREVKYLAHHILRPLRNITAFLKEKSERRIS
jgi:hypothetical protein